MFDDKHVREAIEAEAYLKGEAKGKAKGIAEGEAKGIAKVMKLLRAKRASPDLIAAVQALK